MKDMNEKEILRHVDHTLLSQEAVWDEIRQVCDDAVKYDTASVCIPPSYVKQAAEYVGGRVPICTVIGFPNGYETTAVKEFETKDAIANGADEIDMVVNLGWVKEGRYDRVLEAFWFCLKVAVILLTTLGVISFFGAEAIMGLFRKGDLEVIRIGTWAMRFQCLTLPFQAWIIMSNMLTQTIGYGFRASFVAAGRQT